jgi:hypothetical protein
VTVLMLLTQIVRAQDPATPEDLRAILTFRDEHLSIRELRTVIPGRVSVTNSGWGRRPWRGYMWTTSDVVQAPPEVLDSWVIFEGPQRLSVPEYLDEIGRTTDAVALDRRIRRNSTTGKVFGGLALVGLAGAVGGIVGSFADGPDSQIPWTTVGLSGLGTSLVSSIVSGSTSTRAGKLASDFTTTQELETVQDEVRDHNEELRTELGLSPAQAYRELDAPRRRQPGS